jgi:hypothetical protein
MTFKRSLAKRPAVHHACVLDCASPLALFCHGDLDVLWTLGLLVLGTSLSEATRGSIGVQPWFKSPSLIHPHFSHQPVSTLPKPFQPYPTLFRNKKDCLFFQPSAGVQASACLLRRSPASVERRRGVPWPLQRFNHSTFLLPFTTLAHLGTRPLPTYAHPPPLQKFQKCLIIQTKALPGCVTNG